MRKIIILSKEIPDKILLKKIKLRYDLPDYDLFPDINNKAICLGSLDTVKSYTKYFTVLADSVNTIPESCEWVHFKNIIQKTVRSDDFIGDGSLQYWVHLALLKHKILY